MNKIDKLYVSFLDNKGNRLFGSERINNKNTRYVIGREPNHDGELRDMPIEVPGADNSISKRQAEIFFKRPDLDPTSNQTKDNGNWMIKHLSEAKNIKTIMFEDNFQNQISVEPGSPEILSLDNEKQVFGLFIGIPSSSLQSGAIIQIDTGISEANLLDPGEEFDFKLLGGEETHWWNANEMKLNGIFVPGELSKIPDQIFRSLAKSSPEKPISNEVLINSVEDWDGNPDDDDMKDRLKSQISYINKKLEKINSNGENSLKVETSKGKGRFLIFDSK